MATVLYEFEMFDYGTSGWDGILNTNFEKLEEHLHSRVLGYLGEGVSRGDAVYLKSDGNWYQAQANGTKQPCMGIAVEQGALGARIRIQKKGPVTYASWTWTRGSVLYLSTTSLGGLTQTRPGSNIQAVGIAMTPTRVWMDGNLIVE